MPYKNREDMKAHRRRYRKRQYVKLALKRYQQTNKQYMRAHSLRKKVRLAVIHQKSFISTIHKLIGCNVPTARAHLESLFEDWMSWDNYGQGKGKWCIDHKNAIGNVDVFDEEAVKLVFHYKNMQPMEYCKNCSKWKK